MSVRTFQDVRPGPLAWPAYTIAVMMLLMPLADAMAAIDSFSPTMYRWRFGAMGILSTNVITPLFGLLVLLTTAWLQQRRWVLRTIMVFCLATAAVLAGMMVLFVLDGVQVRAELPVEARRGFLLVTSKAFLAQIMALTGLLTLGIAGLRAARGVAAPARSTERPTGDNLVMGRRTPPALRESASESPA